MYCSHCGNELTEGARFCAVCGTQTTAKAPDIAAISANASDDASGGVSAALASGRSRSRLRISPLILLVLVLALTSAVAAASYYVYTQVYLPSVERGSYEAYAPDDEIEFSEPLRSALIPQVDANGDGKIAYSEVGATTSLELSDLAITDISELSVFANLENLNLNGTGVASADLSNMASLASLDAADAPMEYLDVSGDTQLSHLACGDGAEIIGLDDTQLAERWLMTSYTCEGMPGAQILQGAIRPYGELSMSFEYDGTGSLINKSMYSTTPYQIPEEENQSVGYEYDGSGNCVSATDSRGFNTSCAYDDQGRLLSKSSSGSLTSYSYDENGRLFLIDSSGSYASSVAITYDANGVISSVGDVQYVAEGDRLISTVSTGNEYSGIVRFGYDSKGRWTSMESTSALFPHADTWSYDDADRIVSAQREYGAASLPTCTASFVYDGHGNMIERTLSANGAYDGVSRFAYTRIFVPKGEESNWQPVVFEDPISTPSTLEPWAPKTEALATPTESIVLGGYWYL